MLAEKGDTEAVYPTSALDCPRFMSPPCFADMILDPGLTTRRSICDGSSLPGGSPGRLQIPLFNLGSHGFSGNSSLTFFLEARIDVERVCRPCHDRNELKRVPRSVVIAQGPFPQHVRVPSRFCHAHHRHRFSRRPHRTSSPKIGQQMPESA
ncbi:hypothetical protein BD413DRAFT_95626 [Trametes elegans]|nr:hypothetical protein BD413DRAFT_95626 [Trametes elegans]